MQKIVPIPSSTSSSPTATPSTQSPDPSWEDELNHASAQASSIYGGVAGSLPSPTQVHRLDSPQVDSHPNPPNWSASLQTVLDQPPSALPTQLIMGGLVFCLAFGAWAWLGQIDEVGHAQGRLVPQGEPYKIHPVVSGKVARINIAEGQAVKAGQVLLELDSQIATNEVEQLQQDRSAYQTELIQTQALIDNTRLEAQSRVKIADAEALAQETAIAQASSKADGQSAAIAIALEKAATTRKLLISLKADATAHQVRINRLKPLMEQGAIAREMIFEAEQNLRDRQRNITETQGELQQTLAELDRLQTDRQQALAEPRRLQAQLVGTKLQGSTAQIEAQQKIQQLEMQKTQLQAKIAATQKQIAKAKTQLKQLSLTAPVDGIVLSLNVRNNGEVIQPGQTIAEMAPHNAPLILSTSLPNREAGFVKTGMPVQVKLDAYPYQDYGIVMGKVLAISPDTKPDQKLGAVYRVEVTLDRNYVKANHQTIHFKAGQTATADIIIRRRKVADILLDPIKQLQQGGINL